MAVAYELVDEAIDDVFLASSHETDFQTRRRLMRLLGAVAVENTAEKLMNPEQVMAEQASLVAVVGDYFSEEPEKRVNAKARLRADFRTNVFEILDAAGHVSESYSERQADGFYQYGYSQRAMYAHGTFHATNSIEHGRRTIETLNELRIEDGYDAGLFRTHYLVEESRSPETEGLSEQDIKDLKQLYDLNKHKAMWRLTDVDKLGNRVTVSAAVRGVDATGNRYDARGVQYVRETLGAGLDSADTASGLSGAFWVRKQLLPKGIADVIRLHDEGLGSSAFFGVEGQAGDYNTIIEESRRREQQAERDLDAKVHELALELRGFISGEDCAHALVTMAHHAKDFAAELCSQDDIYDPDQFGPEAARHIAMARYFANQGNELASSQALQAAQETAIVYMCGMRLEMEQSATNKTNNDKEALGDCEFVSKKCPKCGEKNVKTKVRNGRYEGECGCKS